MCSWYVMPTLWNRALLTSPVTLSITTTVAPHLPRGCVQFPKHTGLFLIPRHLHMQFLCLECPSLALLVAAEPTPHPLRCSSKALFVGSFPKCLHRVLEDVLHFSSYGFAFSSYSDPLLPPLTNRHNLLEGIGLETGRL